MGAWFSSNEIPRPSLVVGLPGRGKVVYERKSVRTSQKGPYGIEITCTSATVTGIACCPVEDDKIHSPVATVKSGGVGWKYVRVYLEPTEKGEWAYQLAISAEENHETKALLQVVPVIQAAASNTGTTQTQPQQISQRTENKTTDVVIKQHSRKLLMMAILMSETC
jgi:hypothetical protein